MEKGWALLYLGGHLIKRFDGFRRLCRHAATEWGQPLTISDNDMMLANRVLAALGGPPARPEVRGRFETDGLPLLLLFLLTQEIPCRAGLLGDSEPAMARLKALVHLLGHGVYPLLSGQQQLQFQEVVKELGPAGAVLRPLVRYDSEGEPTEIEPQGGAGLLRVGWDGGPYTLAVLSGSAPGPAPLSSAGGSLHPTVLLLN